VLRGVLRQDTVFFDMYPSGVIQERLNNDASNLAGKCFHLPIHVLHNSLMIFSNGMAIYAMRPELLWYCCAPIPVVALLQKVFIGRMQRMHERSRKVAEHVVSNTNEMIKEMRTVRCFAMEGEEADSYDVNSQYKTQIEEFSSVIHHVLFISPLVLMFIATRLIATYIGGTFVAERLITVGMAVQMGNAADHLQHCMRDIVELIPDFIKVRGPVGRICDAINNRPTIEPYPGDAPKLTVPITGEIEFRDVDFSFPSEPQKQILHSLSFIAKPGEKVAFIGSTGCGKSTAIQLIQRFYNPSSGVVLLDGRPIDAYDVHYLRRQISVVAQDNVLFSTTIRENVTYGLTKARRDALTNADVERACSKANALDFIGGFPRGLETYCGERGVKLSGGQKQRLAIARAIIREPTICLLDEATSALDSKSEEVVQAALDQMIADNASGCTLMIAHRLSTVRNCDTILCMHKGHVIEKGTHDDLLDIPIVKGGDGKTPVSGLYHDLWDTQMGTQTAGGVGTLPKAKERALEKQSEVVARLMEEVSTLKRELADARARNCDGSPKSVSRRQFGNDLSNGDENAAPDGPEMLKPVRHRSSP